tara:strand:- start:4044 stop:4445 length:402 start_codon:yes stop_codon:yes gene_type:complete
MQPELPPDFHMHPNGFDSTRPTAQMMGRYQPWHDGHTALFKRIIETEADQVFIMIRHMPQDENNPALPHESIPMIKDKLSAEGYEENKHYMIAIVPNIVNISWGRDVGYSTTQHDLGEEIHSISATKIRNGTV